MISLPKSLGSNPAFRQTIGDIFLEPALKNILQALSASTESVVYISLKKGQESFTDNHNRIFYLWQDKDIRLIFEKTGLKVIHFSQTSSVLVTGEAWLGYVLKRIETRPLTAF